MDLVLPEISKFLANESFHAGSTIEIPVPKEEYDIAKLWFSDMSIYPGVEFRKEIPWQRKKCRMRRSQSG